MPRVTPPKPIVAVVYGEGWRIDTFMRGIAEHLAARGHALAGFVQINQPRPGRSRCDMILQELSSGQRVGISQDRGVHARGCMLDVDELLRASTLAMQALETNPDLLMVNKFGKTECEGGGFRPLIAEAIAREVPVLIAVPQTNIEAWQTFAEGLAINHPVDALASDAATACAQLGLADSKVTTGGRAAQVAAAP
jgi:nucleoside-triphosphatase THEP1